MTDARAILCPYCGDRHRPEPTHPECRACGGRFDAWSIAATQNDMGAWYVRDPRRPHFVGFRHAALVAAIKAGQIGRDAIVRGPSTRQLWTLARRAQGIAHLFGRCHACQGPVTETEPACAACGGSPDAPGDRNYFGLPPIEPIAPPTGAKADFSAFVVDSGLLVVRARAVPPPGAAVVRVQSPAPAASPAATDDARPAVAERVASTAARPVEPPPTRALSPIDRSLVSRARFLERVNRMLFAAAAIGFALALLFGFLYAEQTDRHSKALRAAKRQGADEVRAEFERREPVEVRPPAALPPMPEAPSRAR